MKLCHRRAGLLPVALVFVICANAAAQKDFLVVSIPKLPLKAKERVIGFELQLKSARIARLPDTPIGWSFTVNNDPSWNTDVGGDIHVGAAAVDPAFFHRFLIIERDASSGVPFDLSGTVHVTADFSQEREIKLTLKDFQLAPPRLVAH